MAKLIEPVCDFKYLNDLLHGQTKPMIEIIDVFLTQVHEDLEGINKAITDNDYKTIKSYAHTMKSSVAVMGISSLTPVLNEIESLGIKETGIEKIKELNIRLNEICVKSIAEVENQKLNCAKTK